MRQCEKTSEWYIARCLFFWRKGKNLLVIRLRLVLGGTGPVHTSNTAPFFRMTNPMDVDDEGGRVWWWWATWFPSFFARWWWRSRQCVWLLRDSSQSFLSSSIQDDAIKNCCTSKMINSCSSQDDYIIISCTHTRNCNLSFLEWWFRMMIYKFFFVGKELWQRIHKRRLKLANRNWKQEQQHTKAKERREL